MPIPQKANLAIYRGDSLTLQLAVWADAEKTQPADLSRAVVSAQIRSEPDASDVVATLEVVVDGHIITAHLLPKSSRELPPKCAYDIEIDWYGDDTSVQTVLAGKFAVESDVTRVAV